MSDPTATTIFDVAKYILDKTGEITAMKLQKLTFYVKAWALVWDEEEIFTENFEAWANGAVSPALYNRHRGMFKVTSELFQDATPDKIPAHLQDTINEVIDFYGQFTAQQLSDINHQEAPWIDARGELPPEARCSNEIATAAIAEYYSGIWNSDDGK